MTCVKRTIVLCSLVLFLQASKCNQSTRCVTFTQVPDPKSDHPTKKNYAPIPEFKPKLNLNAESGYESGYESDHKSNAKPTPPTSPASSSEKTHIGFDFKKKIEEMRKKADKTRDIEWELSGDKLTRVVRDSGSSLYAPEDYVVMGLNIYRAAKKICRLYGKNESEIVDEASKFLHYYTHEFVPYYDEDSKKSKDAKTKEEKHWIETLEKKINQKVVLYLQANVFPTNPLEDINKKLRLAENYVGLEDTHYDVTTTFNIKGQKFRLEDKKSFPLTEQQKEKIRNRQLENWYTSLDPFEKMLFDAYADKFLDDIHYIPTQLREVIGCRNAYEKYIKAYDENGKAFELGHYYHSGSLPSPNEKEKEEDKKADWEITQQNWAQIQQKDKNMVWICLNYNLNMPFFKQLREKKIVQDTMKAVGRDQFMNFSINRIGTTPIFRDLVHKLPNELPGDSKNTDQNRQLENQKRYKYSKSLKRLQKAANQFNIENISEQNIKQGDNYFANLAADYALCKILLGESCVISCKSGKDRTGMMSSWVDSKLIRAHYPCLDSNKSPVYKDLVRSGHYQFLSSVNGGMPGRFGMKSVRTNEEAHPFTQQLFCRAAGLTVIPLDKDKKDEEGSVQNSDKEAFLPRLRSSNSS